MRSSHSKMPVPTYPIIAITPPPTPRISASPQRSKNPSICPRAGLSGRYTTSAVCPRAESGVVAVWLEIDAPRLAGAVRVGEHGGVARAEARVGLLDGHDVRDGVLRVGKEGAFPEKHAFPPAEDHDAHRRQEITDPASGSERRFAEQVLARGRKGNGKHRGG